MMSYYTIKDTTKYFIRQEGVVMKVGLNTPQLEILAETTLKHYAQDKREAKDINTIAIANALGYSVYASDLENDVEAMIVKTKRAIYVNKNLEPLQQRFAIARQVAHILLDHLDKDNSISYKVCNKFSVDEFEADNFAVALLMPKDKAVAIWQDTLRVSDFSKIMRVCPRAGSMRLMSLGLVD